MLGRQLCSRHVVILWRQVCAAEVLRDSVSRYFQLPAVNCCCPLLPSGAFTLDMRPGGCCVFK